MEEIVMTRGARITGNPVIYYQPVVSTCDGVIGVEALIRMVHPQRGVLPPATFANALDHPRLARRIGCLVLDSVLAQGAQWHRDGLPLRVAINVSARHLLDPEFLNDLRGALAAHPGIAPEMCEIEVTESAPMLDFPRAQRTLRACNALGLRIALDDFGTGSASLSYLQKLPAQTIKVDRSFVRDILNDPRGFAIVAGVTAIAAMLGLNVVAEGVETASHFQLLETLECRVMQGYLFAKPMPADAVPAWVRSFDLSKYKSHLIPSARRISQDVMNDGFLVAHDLRVVQCTNALQGNGVLPDRILGPEDEHRCHLGFWLARQKNKYTIPTEISRLHHRLHGILREAHPLSPDSGQVASVEKELVAVNERLMMRLRQWIRLRE